MPRLTVLICTHNRRALLARAIESIQAATRPPGWQVEVLVVANACSDDTHAYLEQEAARTAADPQAIPLQWFAETKAGKAFALNSAIPRIRESDLVAFVDDDQRVDVGYLIAATEAATRWPDFSLFCGSIVPDWDGSEPRWVHVEGRYAIRPRPVPQSGWGLEPRELTPRDPTPGGGMLCVRGSVFDRVGRFSTELGPRGHDLGGSEDADFIERAFDLGERCRYVPAMLQYHHVDPERLRFGYVLRKAFARARAEVVRRRARTGIAPYHWKKLLTYGLAALLPPWPDRLRFYLVRIAATLGEMAGAHASRWRPACREEERRRSRGFLILLAMTATVGVAAGAHAAPTAFASSTLAVGLASAAVAFGLGLASWQAFSLAGPRLPPDVVRRYRTYALLAYAKLALWAFGIAALLAIPGVALVQAGAAWAGFSPGLAGLFLAALASIIVFTGLQFLRHLLWLPANIAASYRYRLSRLYPVWSRLTPVRLRLTLGVAAGLPMTAGITSAIRELVSGHFSAGLAWLAGLAFYGLLALWLRPVEARVVSAARRNGPPNVLLIGADTLRADRLDGRHVREAAPFLRAFAERGARFEECFTPVARTAPSLLALLTGCWPRRMNVPDNFVPDEATHLSVPALPDILRRQGYWTGALSDWCGADLGKFDLGFDRADVPEDQWNISLFIRQGPKDLRLFLSLFAHNRFGRRFLPEIHYLGGVPQTDELGREARHVLSECAARGQPFFLNVFFSTTHGPFGSEYPYYLRHASPQYRGESKFIMARVTDPWEIIRRQAEPRAAFDLDQIIALYDGCVSRFDDEVHRILTHLDACGLGENTIVVIYSDHGMEFFEHGTWGQGNSVVGDASNRVPLIMQGPGIGSGVIREPVRIIDVAPTILDLCGIDAQEAGLMDGWSLRPLLEGRGTGQPREILTETGIWLTRLPGMHPQHRLYPPLTELLTVRDFATGTISVKPEWEARLAEARDRALRVGRWKLVCQPLETGMLLQLFDVALDPECLHDQAHAYPEIVTDLWRRLRRVAGHGLTEAFILQGETGEITRA